MSGRHPAPASDVTFPKWRAEAVKALAKLHERAAVAMRERDWRKLYISAGTRRRTGRSTGRRSTSAET
jgi:hypothetical protein